MMLTHESPIAEKLDEVLYIIATATEFQGSFRFEDIMGKVNGQSEILTTVELNGFIDKLTKEEYIDIRGEDYYFATTDGRLFIRSGGYQKVEQQKREDLERENIKKGLEKFQHQTRRWPLIISIFALILSLAAIVNTCVKR